jgi:hypothetical protein
LSNEEKTNDYEHFEKGMFYMKILKKGGGGSREKGGGGNEIHAPCACAQGQRQLFCNIVQLYIISLRGLID